MVRPALPTPTSLPPFPDSGRRFLPGHDDPGLLSHLIKPDGSFEKRSTIPYKGGEHTGLERLEAYCTSSSSDSANSKAEAPLFTYKHTRNALTGLDGSTHFSPFLSLGALSARSIFWRTQRAEEERQGGGNQDSYWLVFELLWRDYWKFAARGPLGDNKIFKLYGTLRDKVKTMPDDDAGRKRGKRGQEGKGHIGGKGKLRQGIEHPPSSREWSHDEEKFSAWRDGRTGVPFVDANMRELNATGTLCSLFFFLVNKTNNKIEGYMSNRGRQNVASFLAKQLNVDWRMGAEWFESQLVDHDVCSNYGNWAYGKLPVLLFRFIN
jgi:deoxyribodipyrimidine photo-lyase